MAFDEVRLELSGAPSGIQMTAFRPIERITLGDGRIVRNARWSGSLMRGDLGPFTRTLSDISTIKAFWEARGGGLRGFRVKDRFDFQSCAPGGTIARTDQLIGTGDGVAAAFQLIKAYASGGQTYTRTVRKPVAGTVVVEVNGASVTPSSINTATGVITLSSPPANGQLVKAGFEFDVPVIFESDDLAMVLEQAKAGIISSLPIVEDRTA